MKPKIFLGEWRKKKGFSQRELARRSGVSYATIPRMELEQGNPTLKSLGMLAKALGIEVVDLFRPPMANIQKQRTKSRPKGRKPR